MAMASQAVCSLAYGSERKELMARAGMVERLAAVAAACCDAPHADTTRAWSVNGARSHGPQVTPHRSERLPVSHLYSTRHIRRGERADAIRWDEEHTAC
jgi:hypothetical protein